MPTESAQIKRDITQTAVRELLDQHQIPARQLLAVLQRFQRLEKESAQNIESWRETESEFREFMHDVQSVMQRHEKTIASWEKESERLTRIEHLKGEKGDSVDFNEVIKALIPYLPSAKETDYDIVVSRVLELIPEPEKIEPENIDTEALFSEFIERIRKEKSIDVSDIKNSQQFLFKTSQKNMMVKFAELMRGGGNGTSGGTAPLTVAVTGTQVGDNTEIDLAQLPSTASYVLFVSLDGGLLMPNGNSGIPVPTWSQSGDIVTVYNAAATGKYLLQYVPA